MTTSPPPSRWNTLGTSLLGGLLGGLAGAGAAVSITSLIKWLLSVVSRQDTWVLMVLPIVGVTLAVFVLHVVAKGDGLQPLTPAKPPRLTWLGPPSRWYVFPSDVVRADLTADVHATGGEEERFPWSLAPIRAVAILATVGLGAPMGTEAPVAHLGVAAGAWLGSHRRMRGMARPAGIGGGAAGVAALMGLPLVGTAFMLELERRDTGPSLERVVAALAGGLVGGGINAAFDLDLIRLVVPKVPPGGLSEGLRAALFIGIIAGVTTSLTSVAIHRVRAWQAKPVVRLVVGGLAMVVAAGAVAVIATPGAAVGPGGAAIVWAETTEVAALTLLAVALLRAAMTTAAVAAGGCGGVFVPFLAIGDITGRVFATLFGVPPDLAGSAGAAAGIAGGYRLPLTAVMMVLGVGGPYAATLTCLATVGVATVAGLVAGWAVTKLTAMVAAASRRKLSHA